MVYPVLEELKEQALTCQLCFEIPDGGRGESNVFKQLSCSHTFCKLCIEKLIDSNGGKYKFLSTLINCPNCRALTHIKEGNVDALPSAFQFNNVIEWINKKQEKTNRVCREHGVQLNFFCLNCLQFVCGDDLRLTENHEEHTTLYVKTEAEPIRKAAHDMMEEIGCQLGHWKKAHEEVEAMISIIDDDTSKSIQLLEKYTEEIKRSLISAQDRLKETIMNTQKKKIQLLEKDKDAIMTKIQEVEKKISEHKVSMKNADSFETFIEYVAITEIHEFCADEHAGGQTNKARFPGPFSKFHLTQTFEERYCSFWRS
ncbi:tripartite motif-containing protein 59-like [Antedon mediterranea]|uniref:tripartite motif-containing protein 59-like n=1 Tax=Antedon mediterranea TaxID=105859 RepID=UPI003AF700DD